MVSPFLLLSIFAFGGVGLALSADGGFDWGTDDADDPSDRSSESDDPPEAETESDEEEEADNPFASASDEDAAPEASGSRSASPAAGENSLATVADARALCDEAMGLLHEGHPDRAFDRLRAHWAFSPDEMTQLQREVERTRAVVGDRYGDALDYRLVREETTADALARFVYLERFALHGLRWRFTFYEGGKGWTLNDVYFDDEIEALLE
jgi:hypothetical protein